MSENTNKKIAISGGAGFVGSNLIKYLNSKGFRNIDIYDKLDSLSNKLHNILPLDFRSIEPHDTLINHINEYDWVVLNGANSATKTKPEDYRKTLEDNFYSTRALLRKFCEKPWGKKLVFASSASTYGLSEDFTERTSNISPQHLYGLTKLLVDREIERLLDHPNKPSIVSFRYFNCIGNDESHKLAKDMASPVSRFLNQNPPYILYRDSKNTEFKRDFIHVQNICEVIFHALTKENPVSGIFNLGQGIASSWEELVKIVCDVKGEDFRDSVKYEPLPESLSKQYQPKTEANLHKLRNELGYDGKFFTLEESVKLIWNEAKNKS